MFQYVGLIYNYVGSQYNINHELIALKLRHTFRVYKLMIKLVEKLELNNHDARLALFIALFHDLGRFYEAKINNKFNNKYDHASDSVKILFEEDFIKLFPIEEEDYDLIKKAVYYHNKKELPEELSDKERFFCNMIRDVDKIDIYHVIANDEPKEFKVMPTEKVLFNYYDKELIDIKDIHNMSDTIVLYFAFQDELAFKESREILYEKGNLEEFVDSIKVSDDTLIKDTFDHLKEETYSRRDDYLYQRRKIKKRG